MRANPLDPTFEFYENPMPTTNGREFAKRTHSTLEGRVTRVPICLSAYVRQFQGCKSRRASPCSRGNDRGLAQLIPPTFYQTNPFPIFVSLGVHSWFNRNLPNEAKPK